MDLWLVEIAAALDAGVSLSVDEQRMLLSKVIDFYALINDAIWNPN